MGTMPQTSEFSGHRLRDRRIARGLTVHELAIKAGCTVEAVRDFERGDREPSFSIAARLADALDTGMNAFRTWYDGGIDIRNNVAMALKGPARRKAQHHHRDDKDD